MGRLRQIGQAAAEPLMPACLSNVECFENKVKPLTYRRTVPQRNRTANLFLALFFGSTLAGHKRCRPPQVKAGHCLRPVGARLVDSRKINSSGMRIVFCSTRRWVRCSEINWIARAATRSDESAKVASGGRQ